MLRAAVLHQALGFLELCFMLAAPEFRIKSTRQLARIIRIVITILIVTILSGRLFDIVF